MGVFKFIMETLKNSQIMALGYLGEDPDPDSDRDSDDSDDSDPSSAHKDGEDTYTYQVKSKEVLSDLHEVFFGYKELKETGATPEVLAAFLDRNGLYDSESLEGCIEFIELMSGIKDIQRLTFSSNEYGNFHALSFELSEFKLTCTVDWEHHPNFWYTATCTVQFSLYSGEPSICYSEKSLTSETTEISAVCSAMNQVYGEICNGEDGIVQQYEEAKERLNDDAKKAAIELERDLARYRREQKAREEQAREEQAREEQAREEQAREEQAGENLPN